MAGTFHGNLKAHLREPVSGITSVCPSIGLFAQGFLFIICSFLEKQHNKGIRKTLLCVVWNLELITVHSMTIAPWDWFCFLSYGRKYCYFVTLSILHQFSSETFWILKWLRSMLILCIFSFVYSSWLASYSTLKGVQCLKRLNVCFS